MLSPSINLPYSAAHDATAVWNAPQVEFAATSAFKSVWTLSIYTLADKSMFWIPPVIDGVITTVPSALPIVSSPANTPVSPRVEFILKGPDAVAICEGSTLVRGSSQD